MGLCNNSPYTFKSGPTCTGTYMRVNTPLHCVQSDDGKYYAKGTLMTYYNQEARLNNLDPMEIGDVDLEIDPSGVFQVVFDGLKQHFTNCNDVVDPVLQEATPAQTADQTAATPSSPGAETTPSTDSNANASTSNA